MSVIITCKLLYPFQVTADIPKFHSNRMVAKHQARHPTSLPPPTHKCAHARIMQPRLALHKWLAVASASPEGIGV